MIFINFTTMIYATIVKEPEIDIWFHGENSNKFYDQLLFMRPNVESVNMSEALEDLAKLEFIPVSEEFFYKP